MNRQSRAKSLKMSVAIQWVGQLGSAAQMRACKYKVLKELWKCVVVPGIMYGKDVMVWNESETYKLGVAQNRVAKKELNVP